MPVQEPFEVKRAARNGAQTVPYDDEIERRILGAVLYDPKHWEQCKDLESLDFHDQRNREIFRALLRNAENGDPLEALAIRDCLSREQYAYISGLPDHVPPDPQLPFFKGKLFRYRFERDLLDAGQNSEAVKAAHERYEQRKTGGGKPEPWQKLVQDGADIAVEELPPVIEIVEGLVTEQSKLVIGSGSKSFKTWLTMDLALSIAHGVPFWERPTARQRVLYCNLELKPSTFKRRLQTLARAKGIEIERSWFHHLPLRGQIGGLTVFEVICRIITLAQQIGAGVVILDPVYKVNTEGDENSSRDQTLLFNQLDRITTEARATLILNDHFSKGNQSEKDPLDAIRGSSAKGGDVDAAMVLRTHESEGAFRVDVIHRELPPVEPFVVGWNFPLMELRPELDSEAMKKPRGRRPEHELSELLEAIADTSKQNPVSVSQWAYRLGIKRQTLSDYLPKLRTQSLIATVGEGNNARQYITEKGKEVACRN